jgi:hypothetical protein
MPCVCFCIRFVLVTRHLLLHHAIVELALRIPYPRVLAIDEFFSLVVERGHGVALIGRPRHTPPGQLLKRIPEIYVVEVSGVVLIVAGKEVIQITEHRDE